MTVPLEKTIELLHAAFEADYAKLRKTGNIIARTLDDSGDQSGATAIRSIIRKKGVPLRASGYMEQLPVDIKSRLPLIEEYEWPSTPLFIGENQCETLNHFVEDAKKSEMLAKHGLSSPLTMIISGEPGTGKSLLTGHVAMKLKRPLYVVRLDSIISSLLGDTSKNIRTVFDFIPSRNAVLFLDEIDTVAKLRDDRYELGELKRVVNTVIQGLDSLDDHTVVVAATNHPQLLDPAIWRRFSYNIELGLPDTDIRKAMWDYFLFEDKENDISQLLAKITKGMTGSLIESIAFATRRRALLDNCENICYKKVVHSIIQASCNNQKCQTFNLFKEIDSKKSIQFLHKCGLTPNQIKKLLGIDLKRISKQIVGKKINGF